MARQDDVVRQPQIDPKLKPLLFKLPEDWMTLQLVDLREMVQEILCREGWTASLPLDEAMTLLGYHRVAQTMHQYERDAKDREIDIRSRPPDHRRF